jgi:hypothetical protein
MRRSLIQTWMNAIAKSHNILKARFIFKTQFPRGILPDACVCAVKKMASRRIITQYFAIFRAMKTSCMSCNNHLRTNYIGLIHRDTVHDQYEDHHPIYDYNRQAYRSYHQMTQRNIVRRVEIASSAPCSCDFAMDSIEGMQLEMHQNPYA